MIQWTCGEKQELPLHHIDGTRNPADWLTKELQVSIETVQAGSDWQNGYDWMSKNVEDMPLKNYSDLTIGFDVENAVNSECFLDTPSSIHLSHVEENIDSLEEIDYECARLLVSTITNESFVSDQSVSDQLSPQCFAVSPGRDKSHIGLVDFIGLGWSKAISALSYVAQFCLKMIHTSHIKKNIPFAPNCSICLINPESQEQERVLYRDRAERLVFTLESQRVEKTLTKEHTKKCIQQGKMICYKGRLDDLCQFTSTDLDVTVFFDSSEFTGLIPIVGTDSPVFFSYLIYVHRKLKPHSGTELSYKEILKKMYPIPSPRRIIQSVRDDCTKCRKISKKTLKLEIANHPSVRTALSPPFYNAQLDIAFGFKGSCYKRSRTTIPVYALVIVCLLSGACNILACDGLQSQDVVLALERHCARYGAPSSLYVDNGSNLIALDSVKLDIRALNGTLMENLGFKVHVCPPKAHESRGRVERKIRQLRETLEKLGLTTKSPMTTLSWDTAFAKCASMINDLPMSKGDSSNLSDLGYDIISPNRLLLGRNNNRSVEGTMRFTNTALPTDILNRNRQITSTYMQILIDRIHHLQSKRNKWLRTTEVTPQIDDLLFFLVDESALGKDYARWKLGKVVSVTERTVTIMHPLRTDQGIAWNFAIRNWRNTCIIIGKNELAINSNKYFDSLLDPDQPVPKKHE